ncbi:MAG TPA: hypothetical protein PLT27_10645 [Nitrospira sp.]|nr:hypothetical protein [Nitrospira sp.]
MTYLSLGEAAKAAGVAKGTISKALKSGKLSYADKTPAGYKIDPAELFRAFPRKQPETVEIERLETPKETVETAVLRAQLEAAERRAATAEADRDAWREQAQRLALTDQSTTSEPNPQRGLWSRLLGR